MGQAQVPRDNRRLRARRNRSLRVLVVDDDQVLREMVSLWLEHAAGIEVVGVAADGCEAVELARTLRPNVVLMDVEMPRMSGPEATRLVLQACPTACIIAHTGHVHGDHVTRMIVAGAKGYAVKGQDSARLEHAIRAAGSGIVEIDPLAFPGLFDGVLRLAREEHDRRCEGEQLHRDLESSYRETITALATALDMRDDATQDHVTRVAQRAVALGHRLGIEGQQLADLEYGAIFHDVGKIGIPDSILKSPRKLTDEEWQVIRMHTIYGERIIRNVRFLRRVSRIVRHSHEHWDGSGYPDGLAREQIPIESRIVLVCDAFDVMTSGRRYQAALTTSVAVSRVRLASGTCFDPRVVEALLAELREPAGLDSAQLGLAR